MKNETYYLYIHGKKAVKAGYAFQENRCYRVIEDYDGKFLAQLEVTLDNDIDRSGYYLVDVSYIKKPENIKTVLAILRNIGFAGCPCIVQKEIDDGVTIKVEDWCGFDI